MMRSSLARISVGGFSLLLSVALLLMVGSLLASDRALSGALTEEARIDAQQSRVATERAVTDRIAALGALTAALARDSSRSSFAELAGAYAGAYPGTARITIFTSNGAVAHDTAFMPAAIGAAHPARVIAPHMTLDRSASAGTWLVLDDGTPYGAVTGRAVVAADSVLRPIFALAPIGRSAAAIVAGGDTIAAAGDWRGGFGGQQEASRLTLPTSVPWAVIVEHRRGAEGLRLALWVLSLATVGLLGFGLIRERHQAIRVAERSAELERLYSEVARANTAKSEFLANISHELRTPLNAIVGFVELLKDGVYGDLSPRQVPPVDRIAASATHLRHLVDQVLDIAKIAAGRLEVHPEQVVLRPFVLNIASELESLVNERGLAFSIAVGATLPRVRTDPTHLRQILVNLIGNAVKYTPSGGIAVRARLVNPTVPSDERPPAGRNTPEDSGLVSRAPAVPGAAAGKRIWVALQVVDTGVGIAPQDQLRIFDEFEQVNAGPRGESMRRGTGLGLAISRRLAQLLGGEISVESQVGKGSTFTLWLPVNPADLAPAMAPAPVPASQTV